MRSTKPSGRFLLDLNALVYLSDPDAPEYTSMLRWFDKIGKEDWGVCPLTEAGFIRVTTNPVYRGASRTVQQAAAILAGFSTHPGYRYWPMIDTFATLSAPFSSRIKGHQQVTDAYLLGLAIKSKGVLVTFDKAIRYLAGSEYDQNLLVLT